MIKNDEYYMNKAIELAKKAYTKDEVPVGALLVKDGKIIAKAYNLKESHNNATHHAEILVLNKAYKKLNSWRLNDCVIYITVEPCLMCTGAIIQSRISKIVYGAPDYKGGAIISSINALEAKNINHHPEVVSGVLEEECTDIIKTYFKNKRANIKESLE
jgi:tRNA(adenine34) deaminase